MLQTYTVGVMVPDPEVLPGWAMKKGITGNMHQLCKNKVLPELYWTPMATLQRHLWSIVCSKFHENRGILKLISRNRDMGVFFT